MIINTLQRNVSCCFTCDGNNYDYLEANKGQPSHKLPALELEPSRFESLPESYRLALEDQAGKALIRAMTPSKADVAEAAKAHRIALTLEAIDVRDTANRPDPIPDLTVIKNGQIIGLVSSAAWRKGEIMNLSVHEPQPLPAYSVPQRSLTASELQAREWLVGKKPTLAKKPNRLATLMAKFWDKGDGRLGYQPIDGRNKELRLQVAS